MKRRGIALLAVLLCTITLTVLLSSLIQLNRSQTFEARDRHKRAMLRSLLESGVAQAQADLATDPTHPRDRTDQSVEGLEGTYSLRWERDPGDHDPNRSVNNLAGNAAADGPRGARTVPEGRADVIVTATLGPTTERAEVLIGYGTDTLPFGVAASNHIRLVGDVRVDALYQINGEGSLTPGRVKAGLHSNFAGNGTAISWQSLDASDRIRVQGLVSAVSTDANAIDLQGNPKIETEKGVAARKLPQVQIESLVDGSSANDQALTLVDQGTAQLVKVPSGEDEINLTQVTVKHTGNLIFGGDLVLNATTLYVDGDLTVNGAISGKGTVYVTGQTRFQGDQDIKNFDPNGLAICSDKSVVLQGFDSSQFFANASPAIKAEWEQVAANLARVDEMGQTWTGRALTSDEKTELSAICDLLTGTLEDSQSQGLLDHLRADLKAADDGSHNYDRAYKEIKNLQRLFRGTTTVNSADNKLQGFLDHHFVDGFFRGIAASSQEIPAQVVNVTQSLKLGSGGRSHFRGIVYSNGAIYARNKIDITGAFWANGEGRTGSTEEATEKPGLSEHLEPGDVVLRDDVDITYSQKMAEGFIANQPAADRTATVQAWLKL